MAFFTVFYLSSTASILTLSLINCGMWEWFVGSGTNETQESDNNDDDAERNNRENSNEASNKSRTKKSMARTKGNSSRRLKKSATKTNTSSKNLHPFVPGSKMLMPICGPDLKASTYVKNQV